MTPAPPQRTQTVVVGSDASTETDAESIRFGEGCFYRIGKSMVRFYLFYCTTKTTT